ncbi:FAD-dependent oxidoreductase [Rhizorhabdus argentea]|uniref:FAD-dependent oxidoreductase n=1 Tax=Rhizorhabdus argentea TaxID=1387174 RepID=UPI0030EBD43F
MLIDARSVAPGAVLECDICVIGAGAAGLSLAIELAGSALSVVVLEAGGEKPDAASQAFYEGELISPAHATPDMYRHRRLGGSTTVWGGRCVPFDPIDFEARAWVPLSGWPFGRETLEPFYRRAQTVLDAGACDYAAISALPGGTLIEGFSDPHVLTESVERFSLPTDVWKSNRHRLKKAGNIRVLFNANCIGLLPQADGCVIERAEVADPEGRRFSVKASDLVVASGGIETYRILAASAPERGGLSNHSDMLGRTYMCHLEMATGTIRITPPTRNVCYGFERTPDGVYARRRFTLTAERQRECRIMNTMVRLHHASVVDPAHGDPILSLMYLAKHTVIPEYRRKLSMVEHDVASALKHDGRFWASHVRNILRGAPATAAFLTKWIRHRILAHRKLPYVALHNRPAYTRWI